MINSRNGILNTKQTTKLPIIYSYDRLYFELLIYYESFAIIIGERVEGEKSDVN